MTSLQRAQWARAALMVALTVGAYLPALRAGFIWDDIQVYIVQNQLIQSPDGLRRIWTTTEAMDFYPLTYSTWWAEWRLWGAHAAGYHLLNVLLHAAGALFLWRVLLRLRVPGAWVAALVWALHPVNVESVAWISQTKNTLSMLLYAAALWAWLRFEVAARPRAWYGAALIAFLLALLAKPAAVMLPFVLLLMAGWQRRRITRRDLARTAPFFAVALLFGLVTLWFQGRLLDKAALAVRDAGPLQRVLDAGWAIWFYLYKALLPVGLALVYPYPRAPSAWAGVAGWAALAGLGGWLWMRRDAWGRPVLTALAYFVITLLPVLGFVDIGFMQYAVVADHWQYMAILGPIALLAGATLHALERRGGAVVPARALAAAVVLGCAVLTWQQTRIYKDEETAWRDTLRKNPQAWVANNNLGKALLAAGRTPEAVPYLEQAVRIDPRNVASWVNLALARVREGRLEEAVSLFQKAIEIEPRMAAPHYNLGHLRVLQGRAGEALASLQTAVRLDPAHAPARSDLGQALAQLGRPAEAAAEFRAYVELRPNDPNGYYNLGMLSVQQGDAAGAERQFETAARLGDAEAQRRLQELRAKRVPGP